MSGTGIEMHGLDIRPVEGSRPEDQEFEINMGPQHPSTHGVMRFLVRLKGETVESVTPYCGYIHRGIEKMCESLTYPQIVHLTDRMDYLSAHINNEAVCLAVEKALGIEVSDRVKYIRTILDELTRIASHQLWWSAFGMDLGALTTFFYGMRDREKILDIFEETTGGRLIQSYNIPGGLMRDIHPNFQKRTKEFIKYFRPKLKEYHDLLTGNVIFRNRTLGIGVMSKEEAIAFGATGPTGRGSGWSCDVRKRLPYSAYDRVLFNEVLMAEGDSFARYMVRMKEMEESMNIIEQLIDNIPEGNYAEKMKAIIKLPEGEYFQHVETARGELVVHIISDGNKNPYRVKFRSPNFSNLSVIDKISRGMKIADLIAISGSLDLVIPDLDR
ncbi:MAG: NADH-quinone oxidoreductase subunit [Bacteroidales bacterium]|jgi:NADH-quinone oxidoreductase subunit D/NADH-quinone oxidoreductase subunit C/D|nr:NADH-quinone oxidoreductase subunit [Bacteroidales bacterium]MDN5329934.1 NADH-quinone oxidoreductase subunit [Bacteroidales bacterium]